MSIATILFAYPISHLTCICLAFSTDEPVNGQHSTLNTEKDDDTYQQASIPEGMDDDVIPESPYPPIMEGRLNYFSSSPQGRRSHFKPKKAATVKKQRHMKEAWALFITVPNRDKEGLKNALQVFARCNLFISPIRAGEKE